MVLAVDEEALAHDGRRTAKSPLPEAMAEDYRRQHIGSQVSGAKIAPESGLDAQRRKEVARHAALRQGHGFQFHPCQRWPMRRPKGGNCLEGFGLALPVQKVQVRHLDQIMAARLVRLPEHDQPITVGEPERPQDGCIDQRPCDGAGSDAKAETQC